jgi:hypothetical protein
MRRHHFWRAFAAKALGQATRGGRIDKRLGRLRSAVSCAIEPMEQRLLLAGNVVISEFMADNSSGLKDYYGQNSDWIELHNLEASPTDISGWHLTDSASNLTEWTFPAGTTIGAGGYLVVFASSRDIKAPNDELHTNFKLSSDGEYLGLTDASAQVVSDYGPVYPPQYADVSYGIGTQTSTTTVMGPGASGKWLVPTSAGALSANWAGTGFNDSGWTTGTTGLGFDNTPATDGRFAVTEAHGSTSLRSLQSGINLILGGGGTVTTYAATTINFADPQSAASGEFTPNTNFGGNTGSDDNNFAMRVHGTIHIATAGQYTFGVNSDDGFSLNINGATFSSTTNCDGVGTDTIQFTGRRTASDSFGVTTLAVGDYDIELYYFAYTGTSGLELMAASGAKTTFNSSFKLVGDTANGGLPLVRVADELGANPTFAGAAQNVNSSAFLRMPFNIDDPGAVTGLTLRMKYDDGYIAYLNGEEVARSSNVPATPVWNSAATADRLTGDAVRSEEINISDALGFLLPGSNVLAIQGLNRSAGDSNFLLLPEVDVTTAQSSVARYFVTPTPGSVNGTGASDLGPIVTDVSSPATQPGDNDAIVVTARVEQAGNPVAGAPTLVYRVMYDSEETAPMYDDGPAGGHGDAKAGDGIWTGTIPADASIPGQMVRWYVQATDTAGQSGRWPVLVPLVGNDAGPEYVGTVIGDPTVTSTMPIFTYFTQDVSGSNGAGARGSVFYLGEFYDNIFIRHRGANSTAGNKFKFNSGYDFLWQADKARVKEIDVNNHGSLDDAYIRPVIGFETFRDAGVAALTSFPMRIQMNGTYSRVALFLEQVDDTMFAENGLYENGALYKMASDNPFMNDPNSMEKKNRDEETNRSDLAAFFAGIHLTGPDQVKFLYDNVDIAGMINYMAANILTGDEDDAQKNYFLYRDTNDGANAYYNFANADGTNEWTMLPWDKDLTFGKNFGQADYTAQDPQAHPFFPSEGHPKVDGPNAYTWLTDALLKVPAIKEMYLRRLRTLMDEMLQPPGTPVVDRYYETRLDELFAELSGDPQATGLGNLTTAFNNLKTLYLDARRVHLYIDHSLNTSYPDYAGIPAQQNGSPTINFGAYDATPGSGNQDEEYLQLVNPNSVAVDISGWHLAGGVELTFKQGVVIPAGGTLYVSPDVFAFRNRAGRSTTAVELVQGNYSGHLSRLGEVVTLTDSSGKAIATLTTGNSPSAQQQSLRVTEVMYHPQDPPAGSPYKNDDFEYVEVKNIGTSTVSLSGVKFTDGIYFSFTGSSVQSLAPGGFALVVGNISAFQSRYGHAFDSMIAGVFATPPGGTSASNLDNGGEHIRLADAQGETILAFDYKDSWYTQADGLGNSLVIRDPAAAISTWDHSEAWSASGAADGSPGAGDGAQTPALGVVINEILSSTTTDPRGQWIELLNTTDSDIDISGWYLSNDGNDLKKYQIAAGTIIPAGGFVTFTQTSNFGNPADPGDLKTLKLDSSGGTVYLTSGAGTALSDYQASETFSAATPEVTMGRYITSTGEKDFVAMNSATFGAANSAPLAGSVVINEVMYHPTIGSDAYVELKNLTGSAVNLYDSANPQNTWKLTEGISFTFPTGASISANGYALIVNTDPAFFRTKYNIPASVPIFGPYLFGLDNDQDTVELKRPGDPPSAGAKAPYIRVDQVSYADSSPWPFSADGQGASLNRITGSEYGDDIANWQPAHPTPGAGFVAFDATAPSVPGIPASQIINPTQTKLTWVPASDAQSGIAYYYIYANGNRIGASTTTTFTDMWVTSGPPRTYQVSSVNGDGVESFLSGTVLSANIVAVSPDPRLSAVSQITIVFSGPVSGFDLSDLTLTLDGGADLLASGSPTLTTSDNITWTLGNLDALTAAAGNYVLKLNAADSDITDDFSQTLVQDSIESWSVDHTAPTVSVTPVSPDPRVVKVDQITIVFNEAVSNFDLSDLKLQRNGGGNLLTGAQTLSTNNGITWTLGNLGGLTNIAGTYQLSVIAGAGVTDVSGNALAVGANDSWVMSITSLTPYDTTDDGLGTVTAQGENGLGEGKLKAFDNDSSTKWLDFANGDPSTRSSWIQYQYAGGATYVVTQYTITSANDAQPRDPRDWQLLGSNDGGITWTTLDSRTGEVFRDRFWKNTYNIINSVAYSIYRLNILSVFNPGAANSMQLSEIELIGLPPLPPPTVVDAAFDAENSPKLSFHFSQSVQQSLGAADLVVHNLTTNQDITVSAPTYNTSTETAAFDFSSLPDGNYTATLIAAGISDAAGSLLDGNADGTAGDSYTFSFFVMAGDANHDRAIGFADLVAVAQHYGQLGGATASTGDADHDGNVNFADLVTVAQKYGKTLPEPAAPAAAAAAELPVGASAEPVAATPEQAPVAAVAPATVSKPASTPVPTKPATLPSAGVAKAASIPPAPAPAATPVPVAAVALTAAPVGKPVKSAFSVVPVARAAVAKPPVVSSPAGFNTVQKKRDSFLD